MLSLLIASAIVLGPVESPSYHSVGYYDNMIQVSQRVLDRSIYADIEFAHLGKDGEMNEVLQRKIDRNGEAVQEHCRRRLRMEALNENECGSGFSR